MKNITRGHIHGNGGLRGHSVGPLFPCVFEMSGPINNLSYHLMLPSGQRIYLGSSEDTTISGAYDTAIDLAHAM